jgi:Domain of unknown function (DUF305)
MHPVESRVATFLTHLLLLLLLLLPSARYALCVGSSMIPHHQNAVNMAKTLLKLGSVQCDDLLDEEESGCIMVNMMHDTINSQNHQIQTMRSILEALSFPPEDDCVVTVTSSSSSSGGGTGTGTNSTDGDGGTSAPTSSAPASLVASSSWLWLATAVLGVRRCVGWM